MAEVVKRLEIIEGRTPRVRLTSLRLGLMGVANFSGLGLALALIG